MRKLTPEERTDRIEKRKVYRKQYYQINHQKALQYSKTYREDHREEYLEYAKSYYKSNKTEINTYGKSWQEKNKDRLNAYSRQYGSIPTNKLKRGLRSRISTILRKKRTPKNTHSLELLGVCIPFYKFYLEQKFQAGMTWDNYGKWHIDHIRPCNSFDLTDPEQLKQCFRFDNTQPLWAFENLSKSDSWNPK
jgi:hypothetical protein